MERDLMSIGKERTRAYHREYWRKNKHRYTRAMRRQRKALREAESQRAAGL